MQQDAEECWSQLMTTLSRKLPQVPGIAAPPSTETTTTTTTTSAPSSSSSSSSSSPSAALETKSAISDLFVGTLESSYVPY